MKKIYYVLLVFILVLISYKETRSDCPSGWFENQHVVVFTYNYNVATFHCRIWLNFCCRWNPETQRPEIIFKWAYADSGYVDCMQTISQHSEIRDSLIRFLYLKVVQLARSNPNCFPQCPPCDGEPTLYFILKGFKCLKWVSKPAIRLITGKVLEWAQGIEACDNLQNYCLFTWVCCCDWNTSPPSCNTWCVSAEEYGTLACSTEEPQVPPPGKNWDEAWETECFTINLCRCL